MVLHQVSLGVFGAAASGKSCLILQFVNKSFAESYDETVEDLYRTQFKMGDSEFVVNITDTAGVDELAEKREEHIQNSTAFLIVYDITSRASFEDASKFYKKIKEVHPSMEAFALVGNKEDESEKRAVKEEEGKALAKSWGNHIPFLEASAKTFNNVEETFHAVMTSFVKAFTGEDIGDDEEPPPPPGEEGAPPAGGDAEGGQDKTKVTTGWLAKKPRGMGRRLTRWFVLDPPKLRFYAEKEDVKANKPIRELDMTNVTFYKMPEHMVFKIDGDRMDHKSTDPMTLIAQNQKEFDKWQTAIQSASSKY